MPAGDPGPTALELATRFNEAFPFEDAVATLADPGRVEALRGALAEICAPDLVTVMAADERFHAERSGIDGFIAAWRDWVEPWERFETTLERVVPKRDKVLILVHQTAHSAGSSQGVDGDGAGVLTVEDGRIARVEFHLDRPTAMQCAGVGTDELEAQSSQA